MGCPPTDLKARTGELTPPGISFWAAAKISSDLVVLKVLVTKFLSFVVWQWLYGEVLDGDWSLISDDDRGYNWRLARCDSRRHLA